MSIMDIAIPLSWLVNMSTMAEKEANIMMIIAMLIGFCDGVALIIVLTGGMLLVSTKSSQVFRVEKVSDAQSFMTKENRWVVRFWRSCRIVKIKFGDNNFLESLTPLRCLDFAVGITVQILLFQGKLK